MRDGPERRENWTNNWGHRIDKKMFFVTAGSRTTDSGSRVEHARQIGWFWLSLLIGILAKQRRNGGTFDFATRGTARRFSFPTRSRERSNESRENGDTQSV